MAAIHAKRALKSLCGQAKSRKKQRHLDQNQYHLHLECFPCHLVAITEFNVPKLKMCNQDISTDILLFRRCNISILIYLARIASPMKILFPIC
jgi:hypothetical protein